MTTTSEEVFDFYVDLLQDPACGDYQLHIDFDAANGILNHQPRDYRPPTDQLVGYQIRVPALMQLHTVEVPGQTIIDTICDYFVKNYRPQLPAHVFTWPSYEHLYCVNTYVEQKKAQKQRQKQIQTKRPYVCTGIRILHNIYPAFRRKVANTAPAPQLVLGVCFGHITKKDPVWKAWANRVRRQRTYTHCALDAQDSYYSWDITEEFLDANSDPQQHLNHRNALLELSGKVFDHTVALYVCRGARLSVGDEWHNQWNHQTGHHSRSLYQQGSLVVVTGTFRVCYEVIGHGKQGVNAPTISKNWPAFVKEDLRPQATATRMKDDWELQLDPGVRQIADEDRFVIFLGATESMHNSVCWNLNAKLLPNEYRDKQLHLGINYLYVPEGGTILDICSWNAGIALISARHRWEQLHDSVTVSPTPASLPFQVPDGTHGAYVRRRVLGIPQATDTWGQMRIKWPYEGLDYDRRFYDSVLGNDKDVRRYVAHNGNSLVSPWLQNIEYPRTLPDLTDHLQWPHPPFVPPLLPPYRELNGNLVYVKADDKVTNLGGNVFVIASQSNKRYGLDYLENVTAYRWRLLTAQAIQDLQAIQDPMPNLDDRADWVRFGSDLLLYVKWPEQDFQMDLIYLREIQ